MIRFITLICLLTFTAQAGIWEQARRARALVTADSFNPSNILSSVVAWYDFSDTNTVAISAGLVSNVLDISSNGKSLVGPSGLRPAYATSINGRYCAQWTGVPNTKRLVNYNYTNNPQDVYVVCKFNRSSFNEYNGLVTGYYQTGSGSGIGIIGETSTTHLYAGAKWWTGVYLNGSSLSSPFTTMPTITNACLISAYSTSLLSVHGLQLGSDRDRGESRGWVGDIGEVVIFSTNLSTEVRQKVEGYLAIKWGLQSLLPAGHPYK